MACQSVDEVCRLAIVRARELLGVERAAIFLRDGEIARGTWGVDLDGNLQSINHLTMKWTSVEGLIEGSHSPEQAEWRIVVAPHRQDLPEGSRVSGEGEIACTFLLSPGGTLGVVYNDNALSGRPIDHEQQDRFTLLVAFVATIIRSRRADAENIQRHQQYRKLFECSPSGTFILSRSGRILSCNQAFAALSGVGDIGRLLGESILRLVGDLVFREAVSRVDTEGSLEDVDIDVVGLDGELRHVSMTLFPIGDNQGGGVTGFQGFLNDITPRVRAERALHELDLAANLYGDDRYFHELAHHLGAAIQVRAVYVAEHLDTATGRILLLGSAIDGAPGPLGETVAGGNCRLIMKEGYRFVRQGVGDSYPDAIKNLGFKPESFMGVLMRDAKGQSVGHISLLHDKPIHEEGRLRSILQIFASRAAIELQRRRTEESLEQSRLDFLHAQKMEAVGQLAGGIAHDFNNLLTSILGTCDLMMMDIEPDNPISTDIEHVRKTAERAADLTRQLLAFSRKQILQPEVIDTGKAISAMEKMLRSLIGEGIQLHLVLSRKPALIRADISQLEQVILNTVINSRDALPGGGRITIRTEVLRCESRVEEFPELPPGDYVKLSVEDDGSGIPLEVLDRVFDPYFTTKPKGKGTGLGLATVYGIVKQSGGFVDIHSGPEQGTTLSAYFPRVLDSTPGGVNETPPPLSLEGTETILLVEDEDVVRRPLKALLSRRGYRVIDTASSGEALLIFEKESEKVDLMITDVVMPTMNGWELYERVAKLRPDLRVIFISGYSDEVISSRGVLKPGLEFLQKPFDHRTLLAKVRDTLDSTPPP